MNGSAIVVGSGVNEAETEDGVVDRSGIVENVLNMSIDGNVF